MRGFANPHYYPTAELTAIRMQNAGFSDVRTWTEDAPTTFDSDAEFRAFLRTVIFRAHVTHLGDPALEEAFLDRIIEVYSGEPRLLDYIRLNGEGSKELETPP
jgi:hypothetical protein